MIIVAGGTGFIGKAIAAELSRRGERVVILSHRANAAVFEVAGQPLEWRRGDVRDAVSLVGALAGADAVVGAVQFPGFPNENEGKGFTFENIDHQGTVHLVDAARRAGVKRYVYLSGAGAAPNADKVWFRAKWGAETAVRESGLQYAIFRPSWVYGPEDRALNQYVGFIRSPSPVVPIIGNGKQRVQPVFVDDVARAVAGSLSDTGPANAVYEIGGPEVYTMNEVVRTAELVLGVQKPLVHQPVWLTKLLFSPKALVPALPLPLSPSGVEFASMSALADNSALLAAFPGFHLTPLRAGLESYLATSS